MSALWMVVASLAFAGMGVFIKLGSAQFSVAETVFYRSLVALIVMQAFIFSKGYSLRTPHWKAHLFRSGIGCTAMMTYFTAIAMIPLATAVTLNYTSPLFMALILHLWFHEKGSRHAPLLLALGFMGVALLLQPSWEPVGPAGLFTGLFAGFLFALAGLGVRQLGKLGEVEWRTVYYFSLTCTLAGLIWVLVGSGFHSVDLKGFGLILGMGGCGVIAQNAMTSAFKKGKTLLVANLQYTTVMFASLFGLLIWQETLSFLAWCGISLIIGSNIVMSAAPMLEKRFREAVSPAPGSRRSAAP